MLRQCACHAVFVIYLYTRHKINFGNFYIPQRADPFPCNDMSLSFGAFIRTAHFSFNSPPVIQCQRWIKSTPLVLTQPNRHPLQHIIASSHESSSTCSPYFRLFHGFENCTPCVHFSASNQGSRTPGTPRTFRARATASQLVSRQCRRGYISCIGWRQKGRHDWSRTSMMQCCQASAISVRNKILFP